MQILETRSEVKVKVTQGLHATLRHPKMHKHTKFGIPTSNNKEICFGHEYSKNKVRGLGHSDPKIVWDTYSPSQDAHTYQISDSYLN